MGGGGGSKESLRGGQEGRKEVQVERGYRKKKDFKYDLCLSTDYVMVACLLMPSYYFPHQIMEGFWMGETGQK